jgi:hypothetical protein
VKPNPAPITNILPNKNVRGLPASNSTNIPLPTITAIIPPIAGGRYPVCNIILAQIALEITQLNNNGVNAAPASVADPFCTSCTNNGTYAVTPFNSHPTTSECKIETVNNFQ